MSPTAKIILCFLLALITAAVVRFMLGDKRDLWFKRQVPKSVITLRSKLSLYIAIGSPKTWQGMIVCIALLSVIALECLLIYTFI